MGVTCASAVCVDCGDLRRSPGSAGNMSNWSFVECLPVLALYSRGHTRVFLVLFFGRVPPRVCTLFTGAHSCFLAVLILMSAAVRVAYRLTGQTGDVGTRQRHNRPPRAVAQAFAEKNGVGRLPVASLSPPSLLLLQLHLNFAFGNFNSCSTRTATSRRHPRASTAVRSAPPISVYLIEKFIRLSSV